MLASVEVLLRHCGCKSQGMENIDATIRAGRRGSLFRSAGLVQCSAYVTGTLLGAPPNRGQGKMPSVRCHVRTLLHIAWPLLYLPRLTCARRLQSSVSSAVWQWCRLRKGCFTASESTSLFSLLHICCHAVCAICQFLRGSGHVRSVIQYSPRNLQSTLCGRASWTSQDNEIVDAIDGTPAVQVMKRLLQSRSSGPE